MSQIKYMRSHISDTVHMVISGKWNTVFCYQVKRLRSHDWNGFRLSALYHRTCVWSMLLIVTFASLASLITDFFLNFNESSSFWAQMCLLQYGKVELIEDICNNCITCNMNLCTLIWIYVAIGIVMLSIAKHLVAHRERSFATLRMTLWWFSCDMWGKRLDPSLRSGWHLARTVSGRLIVVRM